MPRCISSFGMSSPRGPSMYTFGGSTSVGSLDSTNEIFFFDKNKNKWNTLSSVTLVQQANQVHSTFDYMKSLFFVFGE